MRFILGGVIAIFLLGTAAPAHAGIWPFNHKDKDKEKGAQVNSDPEKIKLPKPADWPRLRPKLDETHKNTFKRTGRHPKNQ
jgi:hypothetical protein